MSTRRGVERQHRDRRRILKAERCKRCHDQKIKCSGSHPCEQCNKRGLQCQFDEESEKVIITRRYLEELQTKLASHEKKTISNVSPGAISEQTDTSPSSQLEHPEQDRECGITSQSIIICDPADPYNIGHTGGAPLTNPLAFRASNWLPSPGGQILFMGTSSQWSFGTRVLIMVYETATGENPPIDNLLFDGKVYDLEWDGISRALSTQGDFSSSTLPTQDFALYLINMVRYRCGTLFYLFDEDNFMRQFRIFHGNPEEHHKLSPLWYVHYLTLLAFGKAFVVQISKSRKPSGAELFIQAMKLMPDINFVDCCVIDKIQFLCSSALYLQCVSFRTAAYRKICEAVTLSLENGMHTAMKSHYLDDEYFHKCRLVMSSLLGVPMMVADECISIPYPVCLGNMDRTNALQIYVKISQILSKIQSTVYGIEGQLDSCYLEATQSVLRTISEVANQLNSAFELRTNESISRISRTSAHLHLQYHQSESIKGLVHICLESSIRILKILSVLLNHGSLEIFLPFDLDAAFSSAIVILMAAAIDPQLVPDHSPWTQAAYAIFDEMSSRGSTVAEMTALELKQLETQLNRLWEIDAVSISMRAGNDLGSSQMLSQDSVVNLPLLTNTEDLLGIDFGGDLSSEQLIDLANSLDVESLG
ncbi:fungal-specific transcription factor domain-containing protein [Rostrohypoxylon terebratum]|nr:fungal-specific transcription factor domain-containing protein [Rostrohypoxylon terebratum]